MPYWSTETFKLHGDDVVRPFSGSRVRHCAYELAVGNEYMLSTSEAKSKIDTGQQFCIPPGQFALLITAEEVNIPADSIGFISIRFRSKKLGLVNISGFHVDPGFKGRLKFSVYNAGTRPVPITAGAPLFLLWLATLDSTTSDIRQEQSVEWTTLTDGDFRDIQGDTASPATLKVRLDRLEINFKWLRTIIIVVAIPFVLNALWSYIARNDDPSDLNINTSSSVTHVGPLLDTTSATHRDLDSSGTRAMGSSKKP